MFPCESPLALSTASAFCAQLTATPALPYPTRAVNACGTTIDRYSSACVCGPACPTTTTTTTTTTKTTTSNSCPIPTQPHAIQNGDFECGLAPWTVQVPDPAASYLIGSPGHTSPNSFQVRFTPPTGGKDLGVSARIISAPVQVTPNVPYRLTFWTYFDNGDAGFVGVMLNDVPVYTIDARDHGFGGGFTLNTVDYTPTSSAVTVKFEFLYNDVLSLDRIDGVSFVPLL